MRQTITALAIVAALIGFAAGTRTSAAHRAGSQHITPAEGWDYGG
jgi:hypothetical protein